MRDTSNPSILETPKFQQFDVVTRNAFMHAIREYKLTSNTDEEVVDEIMDAYVNRLPA